MNFELNEEHQAFRDMAAGFAEDELAPMAYYWDEVSYFPVVVLG